MKNEFDEFNLEDILRFFQGAAGIARSKYDSKVVIRAIYQGREIMTCTPPGVQDTEPVEVPYIIRGVEQGVFQISGLKEQENRALLEKALEKADRAKFLMAGVEKITDGKIKGMPSVF